MFKLAPPAPPTRDALAAVGALVISYHVASAALSLLRGRSLTELVVGGAVAAARALPLASAALDAGLDSALDGLRDELAPASAESLLALPRAGRRASAVAAELRAALAHDAARNGLARGTAFGGIYHALGGGGAAPPLHALHADVSAAFLDTNQLYPGLFSTARRVEAEAVAMAVALLRDGCGGEGGGGEGGGGGARAPAACGLFTSGGTESVILAVKAHRDAALAALGFAGGALPPLVAAARAGRVLNVVAGATAHPALDKACALLGLRLKKVPVGAPDFALAPAAARAALDADTVLLVASAPGFAHGVVDDVPALGAAAAAFAGSPFGRAGVPLHVDNCLGGLLLSFTPGAPPFDFRASPAVASVSMDLHKFAGAPKGASVVAFRDPARRRMAYSATADYPGGLYATPTLAGSRSGAAGALAWATLVATGADGLARAAARVARVHAALARGVAAIPHLALLGRPAACVVAFAPAPGARFSIFAIAARMAALRGWRLALLQAPAGAHVVVTERFDEPWEGGGEGAGEGEGEGGGALTVGEAWLRDLAACAAAAQAQPADPRFEGQGEAAIYGAAGVLPRGEVGEILRRYCDVLTVVRR